MRHNLRPRVQLAPGFLDMDDLTSELRFDLICKLRGSFTCVFFAMLFKGVWTIRQWQTSGDITSKTEIAVSEAWVLCEIDCFYEYLSCF